ncbi:MAG: hypothetical protein V4620_04900 [Bacteroidota bacterium]
MTRIITITLSVLLFCSCGSGLQVRKSKVQPLTPLFSATIANVPYKISPEKEFGKDHHELLTTLHEATGNIDSVNVYFNSNKQLTIAFKYKGKEFSKTYAGRFSKKGYYEFYLQKKKMEIPPIVPILYSKVHIERYRLGLTIDGDLIVDNFHENSGNILIISAGYQYRYQTFYKCARTN